MVYILLPLSYLLVTKLAKIDTYKEYLNYDGKAKISELNYVTLNILFVVLIIMIMYNIKFILTLPILMGFPPPPIHHSPPSHCRHV